MEYNLRRPCAQCPFRSDINPFLTRARAMEIATSLDRAEFPCHKTLDYSQAANNDGEGAETDKTAHCAGALIVLERMNKPSQMMRICERLGFYDRSKLDMKASVFGTLSAFVKAQRAR